MQIAIAAAHLGNARADLDAVMSLLREARSWHAKQGVDAWREFDTARIAADIEAGRVYVARSGDGVCGTVTLVETMPPQVKPLQTASWNVSTIGVAPAASVGATNCWFGSAGSVLSRVTAGPEICIQV